MAITKYIYYDGAGTKQTAYINVGCGTGTLTPGYIQYTYERVTPSEALTELGWRFARSALIFCRDATLYTQLRALGFTHVINAGSYSESSPYTMWFNYTAKTGFKIYVAGSNIIFALYVNNTFILNVVNYNEQAVTLIDNVASRQYIESIVEVSGEPTYFTISGGNLSESDTTRTTLNSIYNSSETVDPYAPGGTSGDGGGEGTFNDQQSDVEEADTPALESTSCGFYKIFRPSAANLTSIASFMYSATDAVITALKKLFSNPIDYIIGLHMLPVTPTASASANVKFGVVDTEVSCPVVTNQYVTFNCGSISFTNYYDNCLDYSPYTKAEIYLPYIGTRQLDIDDIAKATLNLYYNIDVLSGACVAMLKVTRDGKTSVLYNWSGNCAMQIPVTANNYNSIISNGIGLIGSVALGIASGGASAVGTALAVTTANSVMNSKPTVDKGGSISGSQGFLGIQQAYLIVTRPNKSIASDYNKYNGYPCNITLYLSNCSGFTKVTDIRLEGLNCTDDERAELDSLLKGGVII